MAAARRTRRPFGQIRRLPSGRYQASYTGPDDARHNAPDTFHTRDEADRYLGGVRIDIARGDWDRPTERRDVPTLAEYAPKWLAERLVKGEPLRPRTREWYANLYRDKIDPTFGTSRLDAITPEAVRAWYAGLDPAKPTRRAHAYAHLRTLLRTAVDERLIGSCPCTLKGAGQTSNAVDPKVAEPDEVEAITALMPAHYAAAVPLTAWCALRFGEVAELRRDDVDLAGAVIRIRRAVTWTTEGGDKVGPPKSAAGVRDVRIPASLVPTLTAHLAEHVGPAGTALLFASGSGGHLRPSGTLHHAFRKARAVALTRPAVKGLRFHDLRHTGATYYARTNATLAEIMARVGHSTPGAALRYQHATDARAEVLVDALDGFITGKAVVLKPRGVASA